MSRAAAKGARGGGGAGGASGALSEPRPSFRALTAECILASLRGALATEEDAARRSNVVLVVDDFALSVLNAAVSQNDLLKAGIMSACRGARARAN